MSINEARIPMSHNTHALASLLLQQWGRLTRRELDETRYIKTRIAHLIERKYGISHVLVEHYLRNMERTLPLAA